MTTNNPRVHHVAVRIKPGTLEQAIEAFAVYGCEVVKHGGEDRWARLGQQDAAQLFELIESEMTPLETESRNLSHVGFTSDIPEQEIEKMETWAREHNVRFEKGAWSERELWFDLPDLFVDFVVEVMGPER